MQNHPIAMKTRIATLVIAAGILTTGAFADSSPVDPVSSAPAVASSTPTPNQIAATPNLATAAERNGVSEAQEVAVKQLTQTERDLHVRYRAGDGFKWAFSYQIPSRDSSFLLETGGPTVVFSMPPPPVFDYSPYYPASWYPSISFRFDFGRGHRS